MKDSGLPYIGVIPTQWNLFRLKAFFTPYAITNKPDARVLSLYRDYGVIPKDSRDDNHNVTSLDTSKYKYVNRGDFVINKMKAWQGSMALSGYDGIVSPAYHVFKFRSEGLWPRYAHYLLRCSSLSDLWRGLSTGLRVGQWDLHVDDFLNTYIPLPSLNEQRHIADCLDAKCADIDEAIQSAENSISDYKSYLQARLYQMVTKGLDPTVASEKTSLEWIESAPTHWEIAPHKRMMRKIKRLCDHWAGEPVLSLTTNGVIVRDIASGKGKFPATFDGYQYISAGNLVLCLFDVDVTPRCVGLAKQGGVISPAYSQFEMLDGAYAPYYDYYLRAMDDRKLYVHLTSTLRHSFTEDTFGMIPALRPPFEEQVRIAAYLDDFCSNVDRLINAKQSIIDDLKAYKQSLIYETVTGKKEV